jgi:hypothetical protein
MRISQFMSEDIKGKPCPVETKKGPKQKPEGLSFKDMF